MLAAGAFVGFVYERAGLAGILAIDGATYLLSAVFLLLTPQWILSAARLSASRRVPESCGHEQ